MVNEYKGFKFNGSMDFTNDKYNDTKWKGKIINLYNCEACGSTIKEESIKENKGKCPSCSIEDKL